MDQLRNSAFWVGIVAAGVVLLVGFVVCVHPDIAEAGKSRSRILAATGQLSNIQPVSGQDAVRWEERSAKYREDHENILQYYAGKDRELERWFEGLNKPDSTSFTTRHKDEIQKLEKDLSEAGIEIGVEVDPRVPDDPRYGFNWELPTVEKWADIGTETDRAPVVKELQKRFWIRKRIAAVAKDVRVRRIRDVRFFKPYHESIREAIGRHATVDEYPSTPAVRSGAGSAYTIVTLPGDLGEMMTFGFTLDIMYGDFPKFLREFLLVDREPQLLIGIAGMRTYTPRGSLNPLEIEYRWEEEKRNKQEKEAECIRGVEPVPVTVQLTCHVIDFDSGAAAEAEKKAQ